MILCTFNTQLSQKGSIITLRSRTHSQNVNSSLEVQEMNILWFLAHICTINRYKEMNDLIMWHLTLFGPHIKIWLTFIAYSLRYKYFKMLHTILAVKNQSLVPPFYEHVQVSTSINTAVKACFQNCIKCFHHLNYYFHFCSFSIHSMNLGNVIWVLMALRPSFYLYPS